MSVAIARLEGNERITVLKRHARELMKDEDGEIILEFNGYVDPDKIVKFVEWANDEYKVKLVVAHAELKEYVTMAIAGGAVGAGVALLAKYYGLPVSWPIVVGAAIGGAILGAMSTTLHIRIYKFKGMTRIKLVAY